MFYGGAYSYILFERQSEVLNYRSSPIFIYSYSDLKIHMLVWRVGIFSCRTSIVNTASIGRKLVNLLNKALGCSASLCAAGGV